MKYKLTHLLLEVIELHTDACISNFNTIKNPLKHTIHAHVWWLVTEQDGHQHTENTQWE